MLPDIRRLMVWKHVNPLKMIGLAKIVYNLSA